ncbi:MAG: IS1 family transposase [Pyrinomonadaceae bacterium]
MDRAPLASLITDVTDESTRIIKRQDSNFRTHLQRLHRRTLCFSKTDELARGGD